MRTHVHVHTCCIYAAAQMTVSFSAVQCFVYAEQAEIEKLRRDLTSHTTALELLKVRF